MADELLEPTAIYAPLVLALARDGLLHAAAHVTGGGLPENLPRALPDELRAEVEWGSWPEPPVFELVRAATTGATEDELRATFNLGVGMVLVAAPDYLAEILGRSADAGTRAFAIGRVRS